MTTPTTKLEELERTLSLINERLESHSMLVIHDILPTLQRLKRDMEALWVSDDRFKGLEEAVADIAGFVYQKRTGKSVDSRVRKH